MQIDLEEFCKNIGVVGKRKFRFPIKTEKVNNNKIRIWYETPKGQFPSKGIVVNRNIEINEEMFLVFGLIQAEGTKQLSYFHFQFTNSDPNLIVRVLNYFEKCWGIDKNLWKLIVCYWKTDFDVKQNWLKDFWKNTTRISEENIKICEGTKYRLSSGSSEYGVCGLRLYRKVFSTIVLNILYNFVHENVETGLYIGVISNIPGAHTQAKTLDQLSKNLQEIQGLGHLIILNQIFQLLQDG